jgi:hypothetical protein
MESAHIIAVVAIISGSLYAAFEQWQKTKRAAYESRGVDDDPRIEALEARVQTLERIVTEKGYQLEDEFRRLEKSA